MTTPTLSAKPLTFEEAARPLIEAGLELPVPLRAALDGDPMPLAITTRAAWPEWATAHGYSAEQVGALNVCIRKLVHSGAYLRELAADLSARHDVGGEAVETVSVFDRHTAALTLHNRAMKNATSVGEGSGRPSHSHGPKPNPEPRTASAPQQAQPQKRETIRLGGLNTAEIERRKVALATAGR